jgi:hypothetical protein
MQFKVHQNMGQFVIIGKVFLSIIEKSQFNNVFIIFIPNYFNILER